MEFSTDYENVVQYRCNSIDWLNLCCSCQQIMVAAALKSDHMMDSDLMFT